ncbi:MAG: PhoH family protein [Bacteroidales bacterium]|nr:PhoH family protein [Bacteroidales bacterium]MDD3010496.1 PhoH family protein [Bacteroidales bacterium]MDD3960361.1 PhoH family protein [Bacteroidales bacterium]MDY0284951.1 PhoH family protein [Bacteroidales bacterium]HPE86622.1 PhoH family protein [Bacteroidales bacterium]
MKKQSMTEKSAKIFVLDTSVILYNHSAVYSFADNDIVIPITVLEELDHFKKGSDMKNFEAREFIRIIDRLSGEYPLTDWIPLDRDGAGRIMVVTDQAGSLDAQEAFGVYTADNRILNAAITVQFSNPGRKVVMVTKDINLRIKAKAIGLAAEDFETGKVKDIDALYNGKTLLENVEEEIIDRVYNEGFCLLEDVGIEEPVPNHYFILKNHRNSALAYYNPITQHLEKIVKRPVQRITPRNAEQVFALHAIMNPEVKLVTLQGVAGTGKTLLALAGAIEQRRLFKQVFLARPIVPLSNKDIGYLPGNVGEKLEPYMEPLYDNLKFIRNQYDEHDKEYHNLGQLLEKEKLVISPLAYIRGRSLSNIIFIVDEAQNLTPHEVKTIITRAGEGTKIIFTGDIRQIDTPYLDSRSNGLSYLIDKISHHAIYAHVLLEKGERSELANLANELL